MNYYDEIKNELINNEVYKKAKDYSKNRSDLNTYYNVGRLIVEAQGGEKRAKYGDKLIDEYVRKLESEMNKKYSITSFKRMRSFYLIIEKGAPLVHQLTWSHYVALLPLKNENSINYYISLSQKYNLSKRELIERIKSKEYERLDEITKEKLKQKEEMLLNKILYII